MQIHIHIQKRLATIPVQLCNCATVQLCNCATVQLCNCATVQVATTGSDKKKALTISRQGFFL